jgi:hypothetical protein
MAKPGTAQLFDRTVKLSELAADFIVQGRNAASFREAWGRSQPWDMFFYHGVIERLREQSEDRLGGTFNTLIDWVNNSNGDRGKIVKQFESFFVDGKLDFGFMFRLISDKQIRNGLVRAGLSYFKSGMGIKPKLEDRLPLKEMSSLDGGI